MKDDEGFWICVEGVRTGDYKGFGLRLRNPRLGLNAIF